MATELSRSVMDGSDMRNGNGWIRFAKSMGRWDHESEVRDGVTEAMDGDTCRDRMGHDLANERKADRASLLVNLRLVELLAVLGVYECDYGYNVHEYVASNEKRSMHGN